MADGQFPAVYARPNVDTECGGRISDAGLSSAMGGGEGPGRGNIHRRIADREAAGSQGIRLRRSSLDTPRLGYREGRSLRFV